MGQQVSKPVAIGLSLIHDDTTKATSSAKNFDVDIVAIHGLNGHREKTWTHAESGTFWLRDLLPTALPGARIYSYGYDANVFCSRETAELRHVARDMLDRIRGPCGPSVSSL